MLELVGPGHRGGGVVVAVGKAQAQLRVAVVPPAPCRARGLLDATRVSVAGADQRECQAAKLHDSDWAGLASADRSVVAQVSVGVVSCRQRCFLFLSLVSKPSGKGALMTSIEEPNPPQAMAFELTNGGGGGGGDGGLQSKKDNVRGSDNVGRAPTISINVYVWGSPKAGDNFPCCCVEPTLGGGERVAVVAAVAAGCVAEETMAVASLMSSPAVSDDSQHSCVEPTLGVGERVVVVAAMVGVMGAAGREAGGGWEAVAMEGAGWEVGAAEGVAVTVEGGCKKHKNHYQH